MKNVAKRVFKRKDTYICIGIMLVGIFIVSIVHRILPSNLVMIAQMFFSLFTMTGAFMFSRIVQEEYAVEEALNKKAKKRK